MFLVSKQYLINNSFNPVNMTCAWFTMFVIVYNKTSLHKSFSLHLSSTLIVLKNIFLDETVSVILSDPPCKDGNALFQLWLIYLTHYVRID